jgi:hypothetical protein
MTIYPAFFQHDWTDPSGRRLFVPGTRQQVLHGTSSPQISERESALRNAYNLSGLVMWLASGRAVESK